MSAHERKPESPLVVGTCKTRRSLISSGSAQRNTVILSVTHLNRASLITHYCYKHTFRVCGKCVHNKILVNVQKGVSARYLAPLQFHCSSTNSWRSNNMIFTYVQLTVGQVLVEGAVWGGTHDTTLVEDRM